MGKAFAGISNLNTVSSISEEKEKYSGSSDGANGYAVLEGVCVSATFEDNFDGQDYVGSLTVDCFVRQTTAVFQVEKLLAFHEDYNTPETVTVIIKVTDENGESPVKVGERYVIWGRYAGPGYYPVGAIIKDGYYESVYEENDEPGTLYAGDARDLTSYTVTPDEAGTYYHVHEDNAQRPCVLAPEDSRVQNVVDYVNHYIHALQVFGVDNLQHMLYFNQGVAYVAQGRSYTQKEAEEGAPVCLISTQLADKNGLTVGDEITVQVCSGLFSPVGSCSVLDAIANQTSIETITVKIIGLYFVPLWDSSPYCFSPNTVLMPTAALPDTGTPEVSWLTLRENPVNTSLPSALLSISIVPGRERAFKDSLKPLGISDDFTIYDNGYTEILSTLSSVKKDSSMVLALCGAGALLFAAIGLLIHYANLRRETYILKCLGVPRGKASAYVLGATLPVGVVSVAAGTAAGIALSQRLLSALMNAGIAKAGSYSTRIDVANLSYTVGFAQAALLACVCLAVLMMLALLLLPCALRKKK